MDKHSGRTPSGTIPPSDHFDGKRFFTPGIRTDKSWGELRQWRRGRTPAPWPDRVSNPPWPAPPATVAGDDIAVTHIGHATLLIQINGLNLITDPVFSDRAGPFSWLGPRRVRAPGVALEDLPPIHGVLLSHNHYDHLDMASLLRLHEKWRPLVVTGLNNGRYLTRHGIDRVTELDWWQSVNLAVGLRIHFVPAQHWSQRWPLDRRRALWGGHVLHAPAGSVYFAGDTGYPGAFKDIRKRLGSPDLALLPVGAYEPRWFMAAQHMNPDDAVRAHLDLGAGHSIAMHWGTFQLTDEAIDAPLQELVAACKTHGLAPGRFLTPGFGETLYKRALERAG